MIFVPVAAISFSQANLLTNRGPNVISSVAKPYIVETIDIDGNRAGSFVGQSLATDPYEIARELGAEPYIEDRYMAFPDIAMGIGGKITLYRAPVYEIVDGKKHRTVRSWQNTVGGLLTEKRIELGVDDKINFSVDTEIENGMEIRINRVAKTTIVVPETIAFSTTKKLNANLEKSVKNVLQKGVSGIRNKYYLVTRIDGEEVSRVLQKSEVALEPVTEILEVGTRVVVYGTGKASWYSWPAMESKNAYYAASKTLAKGTEVWVVNTANGKGVKVTILDRVAADVAIDLSPKAFAAIGSLGAGIINVRIEKYYPE